ncbi:hypothetical protein GCM10027285_23240 [Oleiagrimonas citrea]|uniref:Uncharacterized protein n=1 Tax=Oleiagrimonas citrea TaxID=1665687 RepID=A0A846ZI34_9GAMM|nr:hypothetical protein [Oleiagrimonas citrea]NKZ37363.1 hypothetical protein [Oleiagrimonas citrea]
MPSAAGHMSLAIFKRKEIMAQTGSRTTTDEYLLKHPHLQFSESDRARLEECSIRLFYLGSELLDRARTQLPASLKDCLILQFTNYDTPQAKAGGFAPHLNIISISMGLIHRIWIVSQALRIEEHTRLNIERSMLILVLGHELTHVMFGHNEIVDEGPMEESAMEAHSDYFAGLYLARLIQSREADATLEATSAVVVILATALLFAELGGERTATHHSAPVRFLVVLAGYLRWAMDYCPIAAMQMQFTLDTNNLKTLISDIVRDEVLTDKVYTCIEHAMSAHEDSSETIKAVETFRRKWHQHSSLLAPIRDQLD